VKRWASAVALGWRAAPKLSAEAGCSAAAQTAVAAPRRANAQGVPSTTATRWRTGG